MLRGSEDSDRVTVKPSHPSLPLSRKSAALMMIIIVIIMMVMMTTVMVMTMVMTMVVTMVTMVVTMVTMVVTMVMVVVMAMSSRSLYLQSKCASEQCHGSIFGLKALS